MIRATHEVYKQAHICWEVAATTSADHTGPQLQKLASESPTAKVCQGRCSEGLDNQRMRKKYRRKENYFATLQHPAWHDTDIMRVQLGINVSTTPRKKH